MNQTDRQQDTPYEPELVDHSGIDEDAWFDEATATEAAEALREAELEAVDRKVPRRGPPPLESMNIDELRALAKQLDIPDRGKIVDRDELAAAIRRRL